GGRVAGEIDATTPSRTNWRAISVQSHCERERPSSSGRSQAILTTYIATSGGKDRLTAAPGTIVQASQAAVEESLDPFADMLLGQPDQSSHGDQGGPLGDFEDGPAAPGQAQGGRGAAKARHEAFVFVLRHNHWQYA